MAIVQAMDVPDTINHLLENYSGFLFRESTNSIVLAVTIQSLTTTKLGDNKYLKIEAKNLPVCGPPKVAQI